LSRGFVITQTGKKLLAELVATRQELNITRVMVGKGELPQGHSPEQFADLIEPVTQATSTIPVVKNGVISFIIEYRNDLNGGLQEGFWLKEFGVFAQDGENEILLYYASLGEYPQYVEAYENGKVNIKKYPVSILVTDDIKVNIAYAALAFVTEERMKEFVEIEALPYLEGVLAESENGILAELDKKADKETVQQALDTKADAEIIQQALEQKANTQEVQTALEQKADKETVVEELAKKANTEVIQQALNQKADTETIQQALDQKANEMEMLTELGKKADKETIIQQLAVKADKQEVQTELDKKVDKEEIEEILQQQIDSTNIVLELDKKADKETVAEELEKKADAEIVQEELNKKADTETISAALALKADSETMQIELDKKADIATTTEELAKKSNISHTHNYAGSSSAGGVANSATKLNTARIIDGIPFDGSANIVHFGVCDTAADVAEKTVALTGFVLTEGARVAVRFTNANTNTSPTLNVNSTGAKVLNYTQGQYAPTTQWAAGDIIEFVYYSNQWIMLTANARKLTTARTLALSGDVTGSTTFDGSANKTITATLKNSGVTAGTYGALDLVTKNNGTVWVSNNAGLHGTSAISTWTARQDCKISFRWRVSSESTHDYLNITAAGTQILANTSGSTEQTGTLTATLGLGQTIVFTYRKDSSVNNGMDRAEISEIKYGEGTAEPSTVIYESNIENYFEIENSIYGFYTAIPVPNITVDAKGRITKMQTIYMPSVLNAKHSNGTDKEGYATSARGRYSHAEGYATSASGRYSHAEGGGLTTASGAYSHAEGGGTKASGSNSHAEGDNTTASGSCSHAEGYLVIAKGSYSHAGGYWTKASANYQTAIGKYNKESTAETDKFIIGNGTSDTARSNCLRVTNTNGVYSNSTFKSSGADYAEMLEWLDGNVEKEDRTGLFVTLEKDKIRVATSEDDYILGIVSACPSVCGDVRDDTWGNMHLTDIYGQPILEEVEIPERTEEIVTVSEEGEEVTETIVIEQAHTEIRPKLNPEYDNTQEYIPRSERPEWDAVGVLGKLVAIDDGSCEENGWCKVGQGGIATKSEQVTKYRVMKRLDQNHIKIFIL